MPRDPRWYQLASLATLLLWGLVGLSFEVTSLQAVLTISAALATQWACTRVWRLPTFEWKSALITSFSLCLLLRTDTPWFAAFAAFLAMASKFVVRVRGKHLFNPANLAVVVGLLSGRAWVSAGQWGNTALLAFFLAGLGTLVVTRSARSDVTIAFFLSWAALHLGRAWWLGDPLTIPLHRFQSGALLLFGFFMISDPKTTPDHPVARVLYACIVAYVGFSIQFLHFRTNGLMWALVVCVPLVPLFDLFFRARRFEWSAPSRPWSLA